MEYTLYILLLFVAMSFLLKTGFYSWWGILLIAVISAVFILCVGSWATGQSKTELTGYLSSRSVILNASVCITMEAVIMMAFCFDCFSEFRHRDTFSKRLISRFLYLYPGLLFSAVTCFALMQALFHFPGVEFQTIINITAFGVLFFVSGGALLMRYLFKENYLRLELLFIINLFIIILGIIVTGN